MSINSAFSYELVIISPYPLPSFLSPPPLAIHLNNLPLVTHKRMANIMLTSTESMAYSSSIELILSLLLLLA